MATNLYKKLIVHNGTAHADDFFSACCVLALGITYRVERKTPTPEEMQDDSILIIDVGMDHNESNHFDHHQLPSGTIDCGLSLFLKSIGYHDLFNEVFPWYMPTIVRDCLGRYGMANHYEISMKMVDALTSPIHLSKLRDFSRRSEVILNAGDALADEMARIGRDFFQAVNEWKELRDEDFIIQMDDIKVLDLTDGKVRYCKDVLVARDEPDVILMKDNRGPGYSLVRVNESSSIDFRKCQGCFFVNFIHNSGFCLTTKHRDPGEVTSALRLARA